jgi:large subunit ribosomal protein L9
MKVILIEDVEGTGRRGQVLEVKDGFGRNFLVPNKFALPATAGNLKRLEHIIKDLQNKKERSLKAAEDVKGRLEALTLTIRKKAGADGKLFGSVTPKEIAEALERAFAVTIDKKLIRAKEPIKMIGAYAVSIHLSEGVHAALKVEVEKEE